MTSEPSCAPGWCMRNPRERRMRMQLKDSTVLSGEEPFLQLRILELRLCRCDRRHSRRCAQVFGSIRLSWRFGARATFR
jgi:hypothetical protein